MIYKIGDKVKIVNEAFLPERFNGKIGEIVNIKHDIYYLDIAPYHYPFEASELILYNHKKHKIKLP